MSNSRTASEKAAPKEGKPDYQALATQFSNQIKHLEDASRYREQEKAVLQAKLEVYERREEETAWLRRMVEQMAAGLLPERKVGSNSGFAARNL